VAALRRKLTEANARAEGLASAAGAAASRHEEILSKMADAHKVMKWRYIPFVHEIEVHAQVHLIFYLVMMGCVILSRRSQCCL